MARGEGDRLFRASVETYQITGPRYDSRIKRAFVEELQSVKRE